MKFRSTLRRSPEVSLRDAVLHGSAPDGGTVFTQADCNTDYSSAACSDGDRSKLDATGACVTALGTCSPATQSSFTYGYLLCIIGDPDGGEGFYSVSSACQAQFGGNI